MAELNWYTVTMRNGNTCSTSEIQAYSAHDAVVCKEAEMCPHGWKVSSVKCGKIGLTMPTAQEICGGTIHRSPEEWYEWILKQPRDNYLGIPMATFHRGLSNAMLDMRERCAKLVDDTGWRALPYYEVSQMIREVKP